MTTRWTHSPATVLSAGLILGTAQAAVVLTVVSWRYVSAFEDIAQTGSAGVRQFLPLATGAAWAGAATAAVFVLLVTGAILWSIRLQAGRTDGDARGARSATSVAVVLAVILASAVPLLVLDRLGGMAVFPLSLSRTAADPPPAHPEFMNASGREGSALMARYFDPVTAAATAAGLLAASVLLLRVVRTRPARSITVGLCGVMALAAVLVTWNGWHLIQLPGWIAHAETLTRSPTPRMR